MSNESNNKMPVGTWVCDLTFSFERFAFYTAKWLLAIFVAAETAKGGLGMSDAEGAVLNGYLVAFTYFTPVFGGIICDYWLSPRIAVTVGAILMGISYLVAWKATGMGSMWIMLILCSIGTGLFKGNVSGVNGRLFPESKKHLLDSAFSTQYSFVNIGSFLGTTILGALATGSLGYRNTFLVCGIMLFIDAAWWTFVGNATFGDAGKAPFKLDTRDADKAAKAAQKEAKASAAPLTSVEKQRVLAIILVTLFSGLFWFIWYLVYMPVYYHFGPVSEAGQGAANWALGSLNIPTAWFDSLNAFGCIALGPVFGALWTRLKARPQGDLNMFQKTALGMIMLGACLAAMVAADIVRGDGACSILWIVLVGVLQTVGEMIFSPLGNSFISKLSPTKLLGTLLGAYNIPIFIVGLTYGHVWNFLKVQPSFATAFGILGAIVLGLGIILLVFSKQLNKLSHEDEL